MKKSIMEALASYDPDTDVQEAVGLRSRKASGKEKRPQHPCIAQLSHLTSSFHRERATFRHAFTFATGGTCTLFTSVYEM